MAQLEDLKRVVAGTVDDKFFGEPPPLQGLRGDDEGNLTSKELVAWFETQVANLGHKAVEEVVVRFEQALQDEGVSLPASAVTTFLESSHFCCSLGQLLLCPLAIFFQALQSSQFRCFFAARRYRAMNTSGPQDEAEDTDVQQVLKVLEQCKEDVYLTLPPSTPAMQVAGRS